MLTRWSCALGLIAATVLPAFDAHAQAPAPTPAPVSLPEAQSAAPHKTAPPAAAAGGQAEPAPGVAAAPSPAAAESAAEPDPELVRLVQLELLRVGCTAGPVDGRWGPASEEAVERFNEHARWRFDPSTPTPALVAALRRSDGRVCPLECAAGSEARGNTCVAVKPPPAPRKKQAERTPEPRRSAAPPKRERSTAGRQRPQRPAPRTATPPERRAGAEEGRGRLRCRFVPRATGGGFNGDTIEVCD